MFLLFCGEQPYSLSWVENSTWRHIHMAMLKERKLMLVHSQTGKVKSKELVGCEWRENDHVVTGFGAKISVSFSVGSCSIVFGADGKEKEDF